MLNGSEKKETFDIGQEVFAQYRCRSLSHIDGLQHPGNIVESSSLAAVPLPETTYELCLPSTLLKEGILSSLQVESIVHACAKHLSFLPSGERAGFCIGDGAGVGKGRQIAGIILQNFCLGRTKSVWISTSLDLHIDAKRDLSDLGAHLPVIKNIQDLTSRLNRPKEGVLFCTYSTLSKTNQLKNLIDWVGGAEWNGVLVFDEAHKAKHGSLKDGQGTLIAAAVLQLQKLLPKCRVVYASATGVSGIKNMAYLSRLGLYGVGCSFPTFEDMVQSLGKKGISLLELLAIELKSRGSLVARALSYHGAEFKDMEVELSDDQIRMYNEAVEIFREVKSKFEESSAILGGDQSWTKIYYGAQQRFFKLLCMNMKVEAVVRDVKQSLHDGYCAIIGLQSTGESASSMLNLKNGMTYEMVSVTKEILVQFVEKHFPVYKVEPDTNHVVYHEKCIKMKDDLLMKILEMALPGNPIDLIIDGLGGPDAVAEMTGRRGRLVRTTSTRWVFQNRALEASEIDSINVKEKSAFMSGQKVVAIVSDAASTGISLHADKNALNCKRRVHYTIEVPFSAEKAIQQLGRSHRSNQVSAPIFKLVFTTLGGEKRFASAVARRLQNLGALTRGDRRAASKLMGLDISKLDLDSATGRKALKRMYDCIMKESTTLPDMIQLHDIVQDGISGANFLEEGEVIRSFHHQLKAYVQLMGLDSVKRGNQESADVSRFLNRILAAPVGHQQTLFKYFQLVAEKEYHTSSSSEEVMHVPGPKVLAIHPPAVIWQRSKNTTMRHDLLLDRGMTWEEALEKLRCSRGATSGSNSISGFYRTKRPLRGSTDLRPAVLLTTSPISRNRYRVSRPATGTSPIEMEEREIRQKYVAVQEKEAEDIWRALHETSQTICIHQGACSRGDSCTTGKRLLPMTLLSGSVLHIWDVLETVLTRHEQELKHADKSLRLVRIECLGGNPDANLVGVKFPKELVHEVVEKLESSERLRPQNCATEEEEESPVHPPSFKRAFIPTQRTLVDFFSKRTSSPQDIREQHKPILKRTRTLQKTIDQKSIDIICDMGIASTEQARKALEREGGSIERAIEWILSTS